MAKKSRIPDFKSVDEEMEFWDTHSPEEFLDELEVVDNVEFPKPRLKQISLRLSPWQIDRLKRIAAAKGIGYQTMVRMWITERMASDEYLKQPLPRRKAPAAAPPRRKTTKPAAKAG
jgi:predicted DNA binding CopG/RHH family protein